MTRLHGRCAVGQRLIAKLPHGHWKTLTFVAGLRCNGIVAPCVFNRPINAKSFLAWVIKFLVPTLPFEENASDDSDAAFAEPVITPANTYATAIWRNRGYTSIIGAT